MQEKQSEWHQQWSMFEDEEIFLFKDWIYPLTLEDFRGKDVLECGCGGGQHTSFIAPFVKHVVAVDLNTVDIAEKRNKKFKNVTFLKADIAEMNLHRQFNIVFSIGVVHHTENPEKTVENLKRHVKPGGKLLLWVYSKEGNFLMEYIVEPIKKAFLKKLSKAKLLLLSKLICTLMYLPIYTIYLLPLNFLPYYRYFENFRKLSWRRNLLNVFDKLNAPLVEFISYQKISKWFADRSFTDIHISSYNNVSWRGSGTLKAVKTK